MALNLSIMIIRRKDITAFQDVRQYIENNFTKDISVSWLCKEFGLNRTKLQEGFHQLYDSSVHAFVARTRMDRARQLLTDTDESIKVIALECGYRSASSFTRLFTRVHSLSPTRYRSVCIDNAKHSVFSDVSDK